MFRLSILVVTQVLLLSVGAQEEVEFPDDYDAVDTEDIGDYNYDSQVRY